MVCRGRRHRGDPVVTFSLVGRCGATGRFGIVVTSSSPAVAARCAFARAGVGAVATQNVTDPRLGPLVLDRLAAGDNVSAALDAVVTRSTFAKYRQVLAVDTSGQSATHSGQQALGTYADVTGADCAAAGNLLATETVPGAMVEAFETASDLDLGDRLLGALYAGFADGSEAGSIHSAGLLLVDRESWPQTDLRVDWSDDPLGELERLWKTWKPQAADYVTRALDPRQAPSYGGLGNE